VQLSEASGSDSGHLAIVCNPRDSKWYYAKLSPESQKLVDEMTRSIPRLRTHAAHRPISRVWPLKLATLSRTTFTWG